MRLIIAARAGRFFNDAKIIKDFRRMDQIVSFSDS